MKKLFRGFTLKLVICLSVISFLFQAGFVFAENGSLCGVDADVMLVLDVSGSMEEGGSPSRCEWSEIKPYGGGYTWFLNTKYNVSEDWCLNTRNSFDESTPNFQYVAITYIPEILSKIESAKSAANSFLDNLKSQDQSGLVSFSDTAELKKGLSNDHTATKTAVDSAATGGATDIGNAIGKAVDALKIENGGNLQATKTIILLTDGKANKPNGAGSGEDPADVAYAIQKATEAGNLGYKVFAIGLGSDGDINAVMLQNIADITGAEYHHAPNGSFLADIYQEISTEMCQYGSISGCKYNDLNKNGELNDGETGLYNWYIVLTGDASQTQYTNGNGCYRFAGLPAGNFTVSEDTNAGFEPFTQTYPFENAHNITLGSGENATGYNFFNYFPVCGNNILDSDQSEQCDDGNVNDGDGCSSTCQTEQQEPVCGNGEIETGEQCDDSNTDDGDGCSSTCQTEQQEPNPGEIQAGDIVINEIMQNPAAVSDTYGEWVEFYNTTDADIDLAGCVLRDDAINTHTITSLIIPANGYAVLAKNGDSSVNGGLFPDYVYSNTTLGNSADQVILECNQIEIDRVEYDGGPLFPDPSGASMILGNPWCVSTSPYGDGDLGTPGAQNDSCGDEPVCYTITATSGTGGIIDPSGDVCVDQGNDQLFGVSADSGYEIQDVLVDSVSVGAMSSYNFENVTSNHTILANFSLIDTEPDPDPDPDPDLPATYTITATAGSCGTIQPSGVISVDEGNDQMFDISANSGCGILDVLVDSVSAGDVATYTFYDVLANHTIEATFYELPSNGGGGGGGGGGGLPIYMITSSAGPNGSIDPLGVVAVNYGYSKIYTITPNEGYEVEDILVDDVSVGAMNIYVFGNVLSNHTISVSFKKSEEVAGASTGASTEGPEDELPPEEQEVYTGTGGPVQPTGGTGSSSGSQTTTGSILGETTEGDSTEGDSTEGDSTEGDSTEGDSTEGDFEIVDLEQEPSEFLAALPLQKLISFFKNLCWLCWLILLLMLIYFLYRLYRSYIEKKNKE